MRRPIEIVSNRQPHKLAIIALVLDHKPGDIISDGEIDQATDSQIAVWNSAMQAARRVLADEHGVILKREAKLGYRYLKAEEKSGASDREMKRARNRVKSAKRITDSMSNDEFKQMPAGDQTVYVQTRARVELAHDMFSTRRRPERAITQNSKERPILPK